MSRAPSISSYTRFAEPTFNGSRALTSVKNSHRPDNIKKRRGAETPAPRSRFFITQEDTAGEFYDKTFDASTPNKDYGIPKGYHYISDKRVKGILGRLDSTVTRLNNVWDSCEKSLIKSSSTSILRPHKHSTTFALTEATINGMNQSVSTKGGVQNLLSMTMSEFLNPDVTIKMQQIAQTVDMDTRTNEMRDHLWDHINKGRDYLNLLKEEIRKKREKLQSMKERLETYDIMADNRDLEEKIANLNQEIRKAEGNIEMAEMETDILHNTIYQKKRDKLLYEKKFTLQFFPFVKVEKDLEKGIDNILSMEKIFQQYVSDVADLKKDTKENAMMVKKISSAQKLREQKDQRFEDNIEMEAIYRKKRKTFIIKTKKEIEEDLQRRKDRDEDAQRQKLSGLRELKLEFENNFDLLSTVSKKYDNKEEYVEHLDKLKENHSDLQQRVQEMSEDINLKRKIDLPTLQAELNELRGTKDTTDRFLEGSRLRSELNEKHKRNEIMEASLAFRQKLNTNLIRGIMTIFNNVTIVKDYLNLNKLDNIKLKLDNLGDVLLFCGEVVEILGKNRQTPAEIRSQPLSPISLSDEE